MVPGCLDGFSNLKPYMRRFEALPTIAAYMSSDQYLERPLNNPYASFK